MRGCTGIPKPRSTLGLASQAHSNNSDVWIGHGEQGDWMYEPAECQDDAANHGREKEEIGNAHSVQDHNVQRHERDATVFAQFKQEMPRYVACGQETHRAKTTERME